jgi:hypothetical protein
MDGLISQANKFFSTGKYCNIQVLCALTLSLPWLAFLLYTDFPLCRYKLGGSLVFFLLIPVVSSAVCLWHKPLLGIGLSSLLFLWAITCVNYLQSFYFNSICKISPFLKGQILFIPTLLAAVGCMAVVSSPLKFLHSCEFSDSDRNMLRNFEMFWPFIGSILLMSMPFSMSILSYKYGYEIPLLSLVVGLVYVCFRMRIVSPYTLRHFAKNLPVLQAKSTRIYKYWKIVLIVVSLVSIVNEYQYRGNWLLWGESFITFLSFNFLLYKSTSFLIQQNLHTTELYLPSFTSKGTIIILVSLFIVSLLVPLYLPTANDIKALF